MEDRLSIVAACDHVVQTTFDPDPGLSSHVRDCTFNDGFLRKSAQLRISKDGAVVNT
jgi:hypothetical protein